MRTLLLLILNITELAVKVYDSVHRRVRRKPKAKPIPEA
jgi:hypothetical protein